MFVIFLIRYQRPMDEVAAATGAHRTYLAELRTQGILLASGPFEPRTGGAILLRIPGDDLAAAEAIRDADPFWRQGIATYEVLRWNPTIGAEGLDQL